ncbi:porin [Polaromonas sp.]|uniref:porin n=1 Tax=Polaromonas sp. TaxID=1869339 RepID=UPI003561EB44
MKKSLVALAILAAAGVASAQSSVTLFGVVDAVIQHGSGSGVGSSSKTQLGNSGYNSSRLGFRGTEDLGGGMSASFWLEAGVNNDNGSGANTSTNNQATGATGGGGLTFNRRSTVSLASGLGELRLGRDYTPQFWNQTVFDPFGTNGVGTTQTLVSGLGGATAVRASNSIGYFLPGKLGGFYGQFQHYLGENNQTGAATEDDGKGSAIRLGYANGPVNVALATSSTNFATGDIKSTNLGGSWNFGVAQVMALVTRDKVESLANVTGKGALIGGLVPMGAGQIRVAYSTYKTNAAGTPKSSRIALGYVHNLSKRTALYTTFARVSNSGGAASALNGAVTAANARSTGYDFGIKHSF